MAYQITVTVNYGSGSGSYPYGGWPVSIVAAGNPGYTFSHWTIGGNCTIADANAPSTTLYTGNYGNGTTAAATATYTANPVSHYTLTVNGGSGSGNYTAGSVVAIAATVPSGRVFDHWEGTGAAYVANIHNASTTITMPGNDVALTAVFSSEMPVMLIS